MQGHLVRQGVGKLLPHPGDTRGIILDRIRKRLVLAIQGIRNPIPQGLPNPGKLRQIPQRQGLKLYPCGGKVFIQELHLTFLNTYDDVTRRKCNSIHRFR